MENNGWIKSTDPSTGRTFYANKYTRVTQWEVPDGWTDDNHDEQQQQQSRHASTTGTTNYELPTGWEEAIDPKTNRTFYINHSERKTTWDRPVSNNVIKGSDLLPALTLNRYGSHKKWIDPTHGSRFSSNHINSNINSNNNNSSNNPPLLEYTTVKVPNTLRPACPSCHAVFNTLKRRHHCRLCGDVYCDGCSLGRAMLPLDGEEYSKSVRVCDCCLMDVKRGNYFTWRRYLTPLQLYSNNNDEIISIDTVSASLSSLSVDLLAILSNPTGNSNNLENQVSIPAQIIIPAVGRHLNHRKSAEYAIRVLCSLVSLGNFVGDDSFAMAIYGDDRGNTSSSREDKMKHVPSYNSIVSMSSSEESRSEQIVKSEIVNGILSVLEWNGSDGRTIGAQEQAAKIIYYITDPKLISAALCKDNANEDNGNDVDATNEGGPVDVDAVGSTTDNHILELDVHRAFRAMLDHATSSSSPSLQRWATASLRHLIAEDQRRACVLSSSGRDKYKPFTSQLVSTGGIMILCSLLASDDSETRLHAMSALKATVVATREIETACNDSGRQYYRPGRATVADSDVVNAIVSSGGCGYSLAQLLISSDDDVAVEACEFSLSLMSPLLTDPKGLRKVLHIFTSLASSGISFEAVDDGLHSYRHAALALVVGEGGSNNKTKEIACLPSLIEILKSYANHQSYPKRSIQLQVVAAKCIAAISLAVCSVVSSVNSKITSSDSPLYHRAKQALDVMEAEKVCELTYLIACSPSLDTLDASRITPQAELREACGLVLLSMTTSSDISAEYLIEKRAVSRMMQIAGEVGILEAASLIRGEWASRGLCYLEVATALLIYSCKNPIDDDTTTISAHLLVDAVDSGAINLTSRLLKTKVNLQNHDSAFKQVQVKTACCYLLSALFEISSEEMDSSFGKTRFYEAIDADCAASAFDSRTSRLSSTSGRSDLFASTVALLRATIQFAHKSANENREEPLPMVGLSESCLLAVGGMCGAKGGYFACVPSSTTLSRGAILENNGKYASLTQDICAMAFDSLRMNIDQDKLVPAILIGTLGGSCVLPMLRLAHAIASNGPAQLRGELIRTGVLVPVADILQTSASAKSIYVAVLCISIVRYCGSATPRDINVSSSGSLNDSIRTLSLLAASNVNTTSLQHILKMESLIALEAISTNVSLSNSISTIALPAIASLLSSAYNCSDDIILRHALHFIQNLISSPTTVLPVVKSGLIPIFVRLIGNGLNKASYSQESVAKICLGILHNLTSKGTHHTREVLISSSVLGAVTEVLENPDLSIDDTTFALETVLLLVSDIFSASYRKEPASHLLVEIKGRETFLRRLIASIVSQEREDSTIDIPPLNDHPFPSNERNDIATKLLIQIIWLFCQDTESKSYLLNAFRYSAPNSVFVPCALFNTINEAADNDEMGRSLSIVKKFLLKLLTVGLDESIGSEEYRSGAKDIVRYFQTAKTCLSYCEVDDLASEAIKLFQALISSCGTEFIGKQIVADKSSLLALLDIVTVGDRHTETFARLLGDLAKSGSLPESVLKFELRSCAIAALSAAIVMDGDDENIIEEDGSSLARICVDCLSSILSQIAMTPVEARAMTSAIGKVLSVTILNRFYIQASRETTLNNSCVDHSINRLKITSSSEARILCAIASSIDSIKTLCDVGGLEAISLLAHDGDLAAIRALRQVCEENPNLMIEVEAHLSIMHVISTMKDRVTRSHDNYSEQRELLIHSLSILKSLAKSEDTCSAISSSENSLCALNVASNIIVASSAHRVNKSLHATTDIPDASPRGFTRNGDSSVKELQIDKYCKGEAQEKNALNSSAITDKNQTDDLDTKETSIIYNPDSSICGYLLLDSDFSLEQAALSLMSSFISSKSHRQQIMNDQILIDAVVELVQADSSLPSLLDVQCDAIDFLVCLTKYILHSPDLILEVLISVVEEQTQVLKGSRNTDQYCSSKKIAASAVSGLQNLYCTSINDDLRVKSILAGSEMFVYLVDSLYVGPKIHRLSLGLTDGILFSNVTSLFLLASGNEKTQRVLLSTRHVSSLIRLIMMTAGAVVNCVLATSEGSDHFDAAMEFSLLSLSYITNETCQIKMEWPLNISTIQNIEPSPGAFLHCLKHLTSEKMFGGTSRIIAMKLLSDL